MKGHSHAGNNSHSRVTKQPPWVYDPAVPRNLRVGARAVLIVWLAGGVAAQTPQSPPAPVFRGGTTVVPLDVRVLYFTLLRANQALTSASSAFRSGLTFAMATESCHSRFRSPIGKEAPTRTKIGI